MVALRAKTLLLMVVISGIYFFVGHQIMYKKNGIVDTIAATMVYPFVKMQHIVISKVNDYRNSWQKNYSLLEKISHLEEQNSFLLAENISLHATSYFLENIQELISFKNRYEVQNSLLAHVLLRQFSENEHSILVDCGSVQGSEVDMVAVYKSCLIGRVEFVYPYYSKVRLITDACCKVAAYCRSSKVRGIHEGCNQQNSTLQFVSHLSNLTPNDVLISSGEGLVFPQGFGIGRLASFEQNGLYYTTVVKPLIKLEELEYCYLIKKGS